MAEVAISAAGGRVPVMVHVGAADTETAIQLGEHANLAGADAISAVSALLLRVSLCDNQGALSRDCGGLGSARVCVAYIPAPRGMRYRLSNSWNYVRWRGCGGSSTPRGTCSSCRPSWLGGMRGGPRFSGPDELFSSCMALGVDGAVGTTYNFMPRLYIDIMRCMQAGEVAAARRCSSPLIGSSRYCCATG